MSLPFALRSRAPHRLGEPVGDARDFDGDADSYLTDGVELYRSLGVMSFDPGQMIALENCRSLDFLLIPVEEFRRLGMQEVDVEHEFSGGPGSRAEREALSDS